MRSSSCCSLKQGSFEWLWKEVGGAPAAPCWDAGSVLSPTFPSLFHSLEDPGKDTVPVRRSYQSHPDSQEQWPLMLTFTMHFTWSNTPQNQILKQKKQKGRAWTFWPFDSLTLPCVPGPGFFKFCSLKPEGQVLSQLSQLGFNGSQLWSWGMCWAWTWISQGLILSPVCVSVHEHVRKWDHMCGKGSKEGQVQCRSPEMGGSFGRDTSLATALPTVRPRTSAVPQ